MSLEVLWTLSQKGSKKTLYVNARSSDDEHPNLESKEFSWSQLSAEAQAAATTIFGVTDKQEKHEKAGRPLVSTTDHLTRIVSPGWAGREGRTCEHTQEAHREGKSLSGSPRTALQADKLDALEQDALNVLDAFAMQFAQPLYDAMLAKIGET